MQILRGDVTGEMELSGTSRELVDLAGLLRAGRAKVGLDTTVDPAPYSRALSSLDVDQTSGGLLLSLSPGGDGLEVRGGPEGLGFLAETLEDIAAAGDAAGHSHLEYIPDHLFIAPESEPLVIGLLA